MDLWWPSVWIASYFSLREWGKFHRYLMPCQDEFLHSPGPEIYPHTRAAKEVLLFRAKCGGPTTFRSRLNRDSVLDLTRDNGHLTQLLQTLDPLFENETFLLLLSVDDEVDVLRSRERIWTQGISSNRWMQRDTVLTLCNAILLLSSASFPSTFTSFSAVNFLFNSALHFCLMASDEVACFCLKYSHLYVWLTCMYHLHFSGQMWQLPLESMNQHPAEHPAFLLWFGMPRGLCDVAHVM